MTLSTFTPEASVALGGPKWLVGKRADSWEKFDASAWPTESEEVWRYSGIDRFDPDKFAPVGPASAAPDSWSTQTMSIAEAASAHLGRRAALVVTRQGAVVDIAFYEGLHQKGLSVVSLNRSGTPGDKKSESAHIERLGAIAPPGDSFEFLHWALLPDVVSVDISANTYIKSPVVIVHIIDPSDGNGLAPVVAPHTVVSAGAGAEGSIVEIYVTPSGEVTTSEFKDTAADAEEVFGPAALVLPVTELDVSDTAHLAYAGLQILPKDIWHIASQVSRIGRDATLRSFSAGLGGGYARLRSDSSLVGQGGHASLYAAYLGTGDQVLDFRTMQDHQAPRTESDLVFKGAVADRARSVYTGMIRIKNGAVKSNAFQTNQNLVLSEGAHADSVPNLDIQENDVKCSHASTVGPIDEEQRYYLESRGVEPTEAERLIVLGFFSDLASKAPVGGVTGWIESIVADRIHSGTSRDSSGVSNSSQSVQGNAVGHGNEGGTRSGGGGENG